MAIGHESHANPIGGRRLAAGLAVAAAASVPKQRALGGR